VSSWASASVAHGSPASSAWPGDRSVDGSRRTPRPGSRGPGTARPACATRPAPRARTPGRREPPWILRSVTDRDHPAGPAPRHSLVGLDRHDQPAPGIVAHVDHVQAGDVEHLISAGAPGRADTATALRHVGVSRERFAWSLPILEAPTLLRGHHHADPAVDLNHAQIRRGSLCDLRRWDGAIGQLRTLLATVSPFGPSARQILVSGRYFQARATSGSRCNETLPGRWRSRSDQNSLHRVNAKLRGVSWSRAGRRSYPAAARRCGSCGGRARARPRGRRGL
jgi:hypothetical protein